MKRVIWVIMAVLSAVLLFGGCSGKVPPDESEIRAQLTGEWVNWLGGEDSESIVYVFSGTEIISQHFSSGILIKQQEGTYSITEPEYDRGSWRGTVTAELGDEIFRIPFRTDREGNYLALGISEDINSPGYAKRKY